MFFLNLAWNSFTLYFSALSIYFGLWTQGIVTASSRGDAQSAPRWDAGMLGSRDTGGGDTAICTGGTGKLDTGRAGAFWWARTTALGDLAQIKNNILSRKHFANYYRGSVTLQPDVSVSRHATRCEPVEM